MTEGADRSVPPTDRFTALWRRVKEHRIAQWTVGYVAVAYGVQHAVTLTSEAFDWPHAVTRISMLLLALGLPVAITVAWYHGERVSRHFSAGELSIISILLVIGSLAFYGFVHPLAESLPTTAQSGTVAAPGSANSVAVLPLANVSGDKDQEYFSDGITDEIMSALAKIPALRVVGRESAFEFKGRNANNRAIGRTLGARYLIEGSVRKAGERVRITAQLVRADDGVSLWTENYDRDLKDVFAVQEDVARAIAASLQAPLGLKQGENLVSNRSIGPESYQDYLRAKALIRSRDIGTPLNVPIDLLQQVVAREPNYAPAWALLAQAYGVAPAYDAAFSSGSLKELQQVVDADFAKSEQAARRAIGLDPRNADAYAPLGRIQFWRGRLPDAEQTLKQALGLDALNPEALHGYSEMIATAGRFREAVAVRQQLANIEPLVPVYNTVTARMLWSVGENEKALAIAQALPLGYSSRGQEIAKAYAGMGRYKEAADAAATSPRTAFPPGAVDTAVRLLRIAPGKAPLASFPDLGLYSFVFAEVGYPERALAMHESLMQSGANYERFEIWQPELRALRNTARFKALLQKMGLVDYWRARGWPDMCHPATGDDFECS